MKDKICTFGLCGLFTVTLASCGFKSDLYLPGQPQKIEQYNSESLQNLGEQKLQQLQNQTDNATSAAPRDAPSAAPLPIPPNIPRGTGVIDSEAITEGVVVEVPTSEEIVWDKSVTRKKTTNP